MRFDKSDCLVREPLPNIRDPPDLVPQILISPYSAEHMGAPREMKDPQRSIRRYFNNDRICVLPRATAGIKVLCGILGIKKVSILTTFDTHYISGCVLEGFNGVKIFRKPRKDANALFVIHEWGIKHRDLAGLKKFARKNSIPLIEDCALTFRKDLGTDCDYSLYSLPKVFPLPYGGILRKAGEKDIPDELSRYLARGPKKEHITGLLSYHLKDVKKNFEMRRSNFNRMNSIFKRAGLQPYFKLNKFDIPYVYMLKTDRSEQLSRGLAKFGVEAGVYWKNDGLFLPCHQDLTPYQIDYICGAVLANIDRCKKNRQ